MIKEIQKTLEVFKNLHDYIHVDSVGVCDVNIDVKLENALSTAIDWGEKLKEAGKELGEKKTFEQNACATNNQNLHTHGYRMGSNDMHDIARPILAKALLRVDELSNSAQFRRVEEQQKRIEELKKEVMNFKCLAEGAAAVSLENFDKFQLAKLMVKDLEKDNKTLNTSLGCKGVIIRDTDKQLQSLKEENKKLRGTKCPGCGHFISII